MMNFLRLNFRKPPAPVSVRVITRDVTRLRMAEWRADPKLCAALASALNSDHMKLAVQVLHNENVAGYVLNPVGTAMEDRAMQQARIEGYTMALRNLEALAVHEAKAPALVPDYGVEEEAEKI